MAAAAPVLGDAWAQAMGRWYIREVLALLAIAPAGVRVAATREYGLRLREAAVTLHLPDPT